MVVPGSHRKPRRDLFRPGQQDPDGGIEVQVRAGSAVFFQQGLLHAGGPNLSSQTRVVLYYLTFAPTSGKMLPKGA
jgi:ectoine hydroxylase